MAKMVGDGRNSYQMIIHQFSFRAADGRDFIQLIEDAFVAVWDCKRNFDIEIFSKNK